MVLEDGVDVFLGDERVGARIHLLAEELLFPLNRCPGGGEDLLDGGRNLRADTVTWEREVVHGGGKVLGGPREERGEGGGSVPACLFTATEPSLSLCAEE